jgi:N-acylglucosamine-6-phosphate 2-epimerase
LNKKQKLFEKIKGKLIVSCQALKDEPLHSPFIMGRMAYAAQLGGASGIRANGIEDIREIKKRVNLPIIGIIKQDYPNSEVFITPTLHEVEALCREGVEIIALDATKRIRPDGQTIREVFPMIREKWPDQIFMADCSDYEEAKVAYHLGFDCLGTTLSGYTAYTKNRRLPDFQLMEALVNDFPVPIIAEGGISTPEELKHAFDLGVHAAVVGSAITRPQVITKKFVDAITH